jgi:hypothetical protein
MSRQVNQIAPGVKEIVEPVIAHAQSRPLTETPLVISEEDLKGATAGYARLIIKYETDPKARGRIPASAFARAKAELIKQRQAKDQHQAHAEQTRQIAATKPKKIEPRSTPHFGGLWNGLQVIIDTTPPSTEEERALRATGHGPSIPTLSGASPSVANTSWSIRSCINRSPVRLVFASKRSTCIQTRARPISTASWSNFSISSRGNARAPGLVTRYLPLTPSRQRSGASHKVTAPVHLVPVPSPFFRRSSSAWCQRLKAASARMAARCLSVSVSGVKRAFQMTLPMNVLRVLLWLYKSLIPAQAPFGWP